MRGLRRLKLVLLMPVVAVLTAVTAVAASAASQGGGYETGQVKATGEEGPLPVPLGNTWGP